MTIRCTVLAVLFAAASGGAAAQDRSSPYDTNPACTERNTDANAPECVLQQEGDPRHAYPPPRKVKPAPPPVKPPEPTIPPSPPLSSPRPGSGAGLR